MENRVKGIQYVYIYIYRCDGDARLRHKYLKVKIYRISSSAIYSQLSRT